MNMTSAQKTLHTIRFALRVTGATVLLSPLGSAFAEVPPSTPLSLQASVPPNIFFLNDDSGSMDYELLINDTENHARLGQEDNHTPAIIHRSVPFSIPDALPDNYQQGNPLWCTFDNKARGYGRGNFWGYGFVLETEETSKCDVVSEKEWRARLHDINPLYYNPNKDYAPWPGTDADGNPLYRVMNINSADIDPTIKNGPTINLENDSAELDDNGKRKLHDSIEWNAWCKDNLSANGGCKGWRYYTWSDADNDGLVSEGELTVHWVKDLSDAKKTNFANWFSYHRNRKGVARYALGKAVLAAAGARIGYGAINEIRENTGRQVLIQDHSFNHQRSVLETLYSNRSAKAGSETPLQYSFDWVGKYFKKEDNDTLSSPILDKDAGGTCQVNSAIIMTDGFYTDEKVWEVDKDGIVSAAKKNGKYLVHFLSKSKINNADADTDNEFDGPPYNKGEPHQDTLADIAMYYYKNDLVPNGEDTNNDQVPPSADGIDTAPHEHLNTHAIAFGLSGTIQDPNNVDIESDDFVWPDPETNIFHEPGASIPARIDDLFHATVNGRGKYLNAHNPETLIESVSNIVRSIVEGRQMGTNSIATSSFVLNDQSKIFVTSFDTNTWSGELRAYSGSIDPNNITKAVPEGNSDLLWSTDTTLTEGMTRTILTYSGKGDEDNKIKAGTGIPFKWDDLPDTHKAMLTNDPNAKNLNDSDEQGESRLNYLRGGIDNRYRNRATVLGDIIGSSPRYVGPPPMIYPDTDPFGEKGRRYQAFWKNYSLRNNVRTPMVYVGVNDGMLHGFNADTGEEILAYVPYAVFNKLKGLTSPDYNHSFFVDQTPTIAEAYFNPRKDDTNASWNTALVGGLGTGGKGLFALNVTDPGSFSEDDASDIVLWEFTNDDDGDMGYSLAKPTIALLPSGRWAAITGNGYDSDNGDAVLFIIYLDANPANGWDKGTDSSDDYTKITLPGTKNGLFSPTVVDTDGDGMMDRVYAGDLKGNLWAFDLSDSDADNWKVAYGNKNTLQPLFKANSNQPITAKPTVIRHPTESPNGDSRPISLMIYFGTGRFFLSSDLNNKDMQSFYAVWDTGVNGNLNRDNLAAQAMTTGIDSGLGIGARVTNSETTVDYSSQFGWYLDLKDKDDDDNDIFLGERIFSQAVYARGIILFTTYTPFGGACGGGGSSWLMFIDALDGSYSNKPIININNDTIVDNDDRVTLNEVTTPPSGIQGLAVFSTDSLTLSNERTLRGTAGGGEGRETNLFGDVSGKRMSWKELRPE